MNLLILGATGGTGKHIVAQALEAGHDVAILARDPAKAGPSGPRLQVTAGDVTDRSALVDAMRGRHVVISAIGRGYSFKSERLIERAVPVIIAAMQSAGLRRLVFTSSFGVGDSLADAPFLPKLFFSTLLRGIYADKLIGERAIKSSNLDWTIVQPTKMTDGPLTRSYRSGERLTTHGSASISRADVAHYLLRAAADAATIGKTIVVSN